MKTEWDYTDLADAYLLRPDYSETAIDELIALTDVEDGDPVCDVGAGVAHLTLMLAARGFVVNAVEPNDAMRANGVHRTEDYDSVTWSEGTGESTGMADGAFALVTFGSSFNVTDRQRALMETRRILHPHGWFACMWNHRDLEDPIQAEIEATIRRRVPGYGYGTRREDQTEVIAASGLFAVAERVSGTVRHAQSIDECVEAWRSHATLQRQAGADFPAVVADIQDYLQGLGTSSIEIPYVTNIWAAQALG
jgi:ubiquinone/menaquinone biosynthesis C-methylase UbiE